LAPYGFAVPGRTGGCVAGAMKRYARSQERRPGFQGLRLFGLCRPRTADLGKQVCATLAGGKMRVPVAVILRSPSADGRRRISAVRLQNRPVSLGKELQRSFARRKPWRAQDDRHPNLDYSGKQFFNSRHRQEQPFGCLGKFDEAVLLIECCCAVIFCIHNNHSRGDLFAATQATVKRIHQ